MLHIYHGDGKGKTTAALGLVMRELGHAQKVLVVQFLKDGKSGEISFLKQQPLVTCLYSPMPKLFYYQMAVSYTHLDVYKRQEHVESFLQGRVFGAVQIINACALPLGTVVFGPLADYIALKWIFCVCALTVMLCVIFFVSYIPVSYTHLDVYKRQDIHSCSDNSLIR